MERASAPPEERPSVTISTAFTSIERNGDGDEQRPTAATARRTDDDGWRTQMHLGAVRGGSLAVAARRKSGRDDGAAGPAVDVSQRRGSHPQNYVPISGLDAAGSNLHGHSRENQLSRASPHTRYPCYSIDCKKSVESEGWKGGQLRPCFSATCPHRTLRRPKRSHWRHPKVKGLLIRAKICCIQNLPARIQPYSSFVPRMLHDYLQRLSTAEERGEGEYLPYGEVHTGAVLLADASGFTVLTERLSTMSNGAEILCGVLNKFFDEMVRIIHDHGGDVIKFAGDAVMVLWESDRVDRRCKQTIKGAALCATQCALAIHNRLHNFLAIKDEGQGAVHLTLHIGIGCGQLTSIHVGGIFNRWEFVVGGPPMHSQCAIAEPAAEPGETVVSTEVWALIQDVADGTRLADLTPTKGRVIDPKTADFVLIERLKCAAEVPTGDELRIEPRAADLEFLRRYIPSAVHKRLEAGHDAYIAEIRPISIVFIKVDGVSIEAQHTGDDAMPLDCSEAIMFGQELMLKIQEIIYEFEGSVNKMMIDDKGQVILCAFGLNPYFHHDDPVRAVRAAMMVVQRLKNLRENVSVSVGVATGRSFCGIIGSQRDKTTEGDSSMYGQRREYTVMGAMVNLAARLMCNAAENGVLVDVETQNRTKNLPDIQYESSQMVLKGLGLQTVWEPREGGQTVKNRASVLREPLSKSAELAFNARRKELTKIQKALAGKGTGTGVVVVITGGRGAGKGAVYDGAMEDAKELGYLVLASSVKKADAKSKSRDGGGDSALDTTKGNGMVDYCKPNFGVWQSIFGEMVSIGAEEEGVSAAVYLRQILDRENGGAIHMALLNLVLPDLDLPTPPQPSKLNSMHSAEMGAEKEYNVKELREQSFWSLLLEQRQILMVDMMTRCLGYFAQEHKTLIAMHLQTGTSYKQIMEPESWMLAQSVADHLCAKRRPGMQKIVLFMTNRPSVYYSPPEYDHIQEVAARTNTCIHLKPLNRAQRIAYIAEYLNVNADNIPTVLKDYISSMGAGNPKNTEEILDKMRDEDEVFRVEGDAVILARAFESETDFSGFELPPKLISTQMNLLERMQEKHRLVVKIASVWSTFTLAMLKYILPYHRERDELVHILLNLVESSILSVGPIPEDLISYHPESGITTAYTFVSKVMQQQARALLLEQQRQEIQPSIDDLELRRANNHVHAAEIIQHVNVLKSCRGKMAQWLDVTTEPSESQGSADQRAKAPRRRISDTNSSSLQRRPGFRAGRLTIDPSTSSLGIPSYPTQLPPARAQTDTVPALSASEMVVELEPPPRRQRSADALLAGTTETAVRSTVSTKQEQPRASVAVLSGRIGELEQQLNEARALITSLHKQNSLKDDLISDLTAQLAHPGTPGQSAQRAPSSGSKSPRSPWLSRKKKKDKGGPQ